MAKKISIRRVKELLEHNKLVEIINIFDAKTLQSFTPRDASFISKSISIVLNHCFYEEIDKPEHNINDSSRVESGSDDSDLEITVPQYDVSGACDINKLEQILDRISRVGDPRRLYSYFISLVNGSIRSDMRYMLLCPVANCLSRIETRRTPLIANVLASMHTLINQRSPTVEDVDYCIYFMDKIWYDPLPEDTHGVSNSCFKSFSAQLNEKLFYNVYKNEEIKYSNSIKKLCYIFIKNEGDPLDWYINLIKVPSHAFKGPLESTHMQESLLAYTLLDYGYIDNMDMVILPLVYSNKSKGVMAMHCSLAIIKSCDDINNMLYKKCILRILSWGIDMLKTAKYKITTFKGTLWEPNEIIKTLETWKEDTLLNEIQKMISPQN